jgi:hypothetical protein
MQNKSVHWLNLTAYLPVILLQVLSSMPFSTDPATVFAAAVGDCSCGCVVSAEESCCCGCPADVKKKDNYEPGSFASVKTSDSQPRQCLLSPAGCSPANGEWTLPPPLPDHLQADRTAYAPGFLPAVRLPDENLSSSGNPSGNPDKVPI